MKKKICVSVLFSVIALCGDSLLLSIPVSHCQGRFLVFLLRLTLFLACFVCAVALSDEKRCTKIVTATDDVQKEDGGRDFKPDPKAYEIFSRGVEYMESAKPFLDTKLSLEKFSKAIFSNTAYVSKSVNSYAGMNFKQFVNSYRIDYAVELMKKDPYLRMEEVAQMSGFHTVVSFDMSFKSFKGKTPSEWQREYMRFRSESVSEFPSKTTGLAR